MEHACAPVRSADTPTPEYRPWDPFAACKQPYPITTYQPVYYAAESLVRDECCIASDSLLQMLIS